MATDKIVYIQPAEYSISSAYRPILVALQTFPNITVFCDIYFNFRYYKSLVSTTFLPGIVIGSGFFTSRVYQFDLQDACQEFLTFHMPEPVISSVVKDNGSSNTAMNGPTGYVTVYCRFRIMLPGQAPDGPIPIQATADTGAVEGGGESSVTFHVFNGTPNHEDISYYEGQLKKIGRKSNSSSLPSAMIRAYTLQTNDREYVYMDDYNFFPLLIGMNGFFLTASTRYCKLKVIGEKYDGTGVNIDVGPSSELWEHNSMYYIPSGVPNVKEMTNGNTVPWADLRYYQVAVFDIAKNNYVAMSPYYYLRPSNNKSKVRIWFQNNYGVMQAVNFDDCQKEREVTTTTKFITKNYRADQPFNSAWADPFDEPTSFWMPKSTGNIFRHNISSVDTGTAYGLFEEWELRQLSEMFDTSVTYILRPAEPHGPYYQRATLLPVYLLDMTQPIKKLHDERWIYEVTIKYAMSNPNIRHRN